MYRVHQAQLELRRPRGSCRRGPCPPPGWARPARFAPRPQPPCACLAGITLARLLAAGRRHGDQRRRSVRTAFLCSALLSSPGVTSWPRGPARGTLALLSEGAGRGLTPRRLLGSGG